MDGVCVCMFADRQEGRQAGTYTPPHTRTLTLSVSAIFNIYEGKSVTDVKHLSIAFSQMLYIEMSCSKVIGCGHGTMVAPPKPELTFAITRAEVVVMDKLVYDLYCDFAVIVDIIKVFT